MIWDLGFIEVNIGWLITFFSGVLFGVILLSLWYLVAVLASLNKGLRGAKVQEEDIDEKEIQWLIEDAHKTFKDKKVKNSSRLWTTFNECSSRIKCRYCY